jgi:hypothetical protein
MKPLLSFILILALPISLIPPPKVGDGEDRFENPSQLLLRPNADQEPEILGDLTPHQEEIRKHPDSAEAHYRLGMACLNRPIFPVRQGPLT